MVFPCTGRTYYTLSLIHIFPSLDGGDAALLDKVNRPAASLDFDRIVEGLIAFRDAFNGQIWLEVMLLGGISDDDASVDAIARLAERIRPDKVQINLSLIHI